jgi:hypothetical protein
MAGATLSFRERWIWYHLAGWFLGIVLVLCIDPLFEFIGLRTGKLPVGIAMALGIGIMEWAQLRKYGIGASWIGYTVAGFFIGFLTFELLQGRLFPHASDYFLILATIMSAAAAGFLQYRFVLRDKAVTGPQWVAWQVVGWTVACLVAASATLLRTAELPRWAFGIASIALILSSGPLLGFITSWVIQPIADQPGSGTPNELSDLI